MRTEAQGCTCRPTTASDESTFSASRTACDPNSTRSSPTEDAFPDSTSTETSLHDLPPITWDDNTVGGWPQLAVLMAKTPDFAAFPRYRDLNIKSLLYYQVQLSALRQELLKKEQEDAALDPNADIPALFAERAIDMVTATREDGKQFEIIERMRKVLKAYNKALLLYTQVSALPEPDSYNMLNLRKWMGHEDGGKAAIRGDGEEKAWGDYEDLPDALPPWEQFKLAMKRLFWLKPPTDEDLDLVVTHPQSKIDGLTKWAVWYFIPFLDVLGEKRKAKRDQEIERKAKQDIEKNAKSNSKPGRWWRSKKSQARKRGKSNGPSTLNLAAGKVEKQQTVETWSETTILRVTSGVSTVVACLLPIVAIAVLAQLHGTRDLLICIAGFAVIFAVVLIFFTQGTSTRVEIFTATAAFSAVLVVFISTPVINVPPMTASFAANISSAIPSAIPTL